MKLHSAVWASVVHVFNTTVFWSPDRDHHAQTVLQNRPQGLSHSNKASVEVIQPGGGADDGRVYVLEDGTPSIPTPKNPQDGPQRLTCEYPQMKGWENCHGPNSRDCWLQNSQDPSNRIDINTDYENPDAIPVGTTRKVCLHHCILAVTKGLVVQLDSR